MLNTNLAVNDDLTWFKEVMDMRLSVSKLCPFLGDTSGTSGSKWRNISIEILKIKINV